MRVNSLILIIIKMKMKMMLKDMFQIVFKKRNHIINQSQHKHYYSITTIQQQDLTTCQHQRWRIIHL
jgi:hypothetical protein